MNTSQSLEGVKSHKSRVHKPKSQSRRAHRAMRRMLPKLCGADIELGNFILGDPESFSTGYEASRALLREIDGLSDEEAYADDDANSDLSGDGEVDGEADEKEEDDKDTDKPSGFYSQDWGRKWLSSNGGCVYVDLNHLELCIGEVLSAYDHVASWHAMLRIARRALRRANAKLSPGKKIVVLVNNSDGLGNSYGSHVNFALSRRAWVNMFSRRLHHLMYLASYQASSIIFTGQGKVGSENSQPIVPYQIASRADHFEELAAYQTTHSRPLCNKRDEPLTGSFSSPYSNIRRYHCIFYDNTLSYASCLLKVGVMQMVLAANIEMERIDPRLILEDPVHATIAFSHDPELKTRVRAADGNQYTAAEHQLLLLEEIRGPVEQGLLDTIVPHARRIFSLYEDTLEKLHDGDFAALEGRLDWVLKKRILEQAISENARLSWESPEIKHLDHMYSSLDPDDGLFWAYDRAGLVEQHVSGDHIRRLTTEPPHDTRAWTRAMLLRKAKPGQVQSVDWDSISFKTRDAGYWSRYTKVKLSNPFDSTEAQMRGLMHESMSLEDVLSALESRAAKKNKKETG